MRRSPAGKDVLTSMRKDAMEIFNASLKAVDPVNVVKKFFEKEGKKLSVKDSSFNLNSFGSIYLIGFGKAIVAMERSVEQVLKDRGERDLIR